MIPPAIETLHRSNRNPTQMQSKIPPQKQEKSLKLERRLQRQERKGGVVFYQEHNFKKQTPYKTFSLFLIVCQNLSFFKVRTIIYL